MKDWRNLLLSAVAGAIAPLAFSPFGYWPLMLLSMGVLFFLLNDTTPRKAAYRALFYGLGLYGTGASWVYVSIHQFGSAPVPLAVLLTAVFVLALSVVFFAPLGWLFSRLSQKRALWSKVLLFAGLWVLGEWLRSWFLTGFPWLFAGYTLLDTPFSGLAPITGVYGLSLLQALSSACLVALIMERNLPLFITTGSTAALAIAAILLKGHIWTSDNPDAKPVTFAAVQGNISQSLKWEPGHLDKTIEKYLTLSSNQWQKDLVFWPENSIPTFYQNVPGLMEQLNQHAGNTDTALVLGMPWYENGPYFNSLVGLGEAQGNYFKQKLVPFGEFVPFESLIRGLIAFFDLPMSSFSAGEQSQPGLRVQDNPVASYICYEVVYPDFAAEQAIDKGFLLTVSNDTWFGQSIGPEQHFQMVRMRSLETGRYQLRVTNDGITALIDPMGTVISTIPRYSEGVLEGEIPVMTGMTPFMRFGSWPVLALSLLMLLGVRLSRQHS
ncbi:apolipoprotein N-acyltransferase [Parendozoicomonas haliclonae]|uniref:Apolipoprotein N-acyltransferase n=1 Tax=Parendozoicomonas haliclonae TaxID=1960125 RepID=A0A1X7AMP2_9GAMM|nr:apolipoprotein N-acyltransferase [Parendozoicomonas haliclonae]SMA49547.1 Apolipoprotein N-acyltransferase [Parendozoicomonas haliclonae]